MNPYNISIPTKPISPSSDLILVRAIKRFCCKAKKKIYGWINAPSAYLISILPAFGINK